MTKLFHSIAVLSLSGAIVLLSSCGGNGNQAKSDKADSTGKSVDSIPMETLTSGNCFSNANCNVKSCQDSIVASHSITSTQFNTMVAAFGTPASKTTYTMGQLDSLMTSLDCTQGDYIGYNYAGGSGPIQLFRVPNGTTPPSLNGKFAIAYFNGLKRVYALGASDVVEFHKAVNSSSVQTVVLKAIRRGTAVFFGDMSELYP